MPTRLSAPVISLRFLSLYAVRYAARINQAKKYAQSVRTCILSKMSLSASRCFIHTPAAITISYIQIKNLGNYPYLRGLETTTYKKCCIWRFWTHLSNWAYRITLASHRGARTCWLCRIALRHIGGNISLASTRNHLWRRSCALPSALNPRYTRVKNVTSRLMGTYCSTTIQCTSIRKR